MGRPMTGAVPVRTSLSSAMFFFLRFHNFFLDLESQSLIISYFLLKDGAARPMTAVRAAGYSSSLTRGKCENDKFYFSN